MKPHRTGETRDNQTRKIQAFFLVQLLFLIFTALLGTRISDLLLDSVLRQEAVRMNVEVKDVLTGLPRWLPPRGRRWSGRQTRYPKRLGMATLTRGFGNEAVWSKEDNVPTAVAPTGCGLARTPRGNKCELPVNLVTRKWRKVLKRHPKREVVRGRYSRFTVSSLVVRPGKRESLRGLLNVNLTELGKPDASCREAVSRPQGTGMVQRAWEVGKSECRPVIGWIGPRKRGDTLRENVQTSNWS